MDHLRAMHQIEQGHGEQGLDLFKSPVVADGGFGVKIGCAFMMVSSRPGRFKDGWRFAMRSLIRLRDNGKS
jgi:hypothetical protein